VSLYYCPQRLAVWLVVDFEALFYQVTTTFDTSCAARIRTAPGINYTACWQLVFIHIRLFDIYLAILFCHFLSATTYPRSTNLFCFFERGQTLIRPERRYLDWLCKLFDKALDRALARGALAMCLQNA
jgi:hypothetical protein